MTATHPRTARALILVAILAASACISKAPLATQSYSIDPPALQARNARPDAAVVSLASVRVQAPYGGTSFVYRTGEHGIERDPYALFAAPPGWMLRAAIDEYLREEDFIRDVVVPAGELPIVAAIEVDVPELYADLGGSGEASAVLSMRFRVLTPPGGTRPAKDLLLKTYAQRIPMPNRTGAAAAAGWNQALAAIMKEFLPDLKVALAARRQA